MRVGPSTAVLGKVVLEGLLISGLTICIFAMKDFWEPFHRGFFCGDESLMLPYHEDTITTPMLRWISLAMPMLVILICEWTLLRKEPSDLRVLGVSIPTWVCGLYCAVVYIGLGACFVDFATEISKHIIGRLRPHFFDVCQPSVNCSTAEWYGRYVPAHDYYCTGPHEHRIENVRKSFVSGHSSLISYAMIYLALYLERRMTWDGTRVLRHTLQFGVFTISWYIALSRVSDYKHHWSDVLAGYCLGTVLAIVMWNWCTELVEKKDIETTERPSQTDVYVRPTSATTHTCSQVQKDVS